MIIEDSIDQYSGYEENYDYLFKKKQGTPGPRQQRKAERKAGRPAPRPGSIRQKRQDKKAGILPKKRLIMGNFGMFNKNKKKEEEAAQAAAAAADVVAPPEPDTMPDTSTLDESPQAPGVTTSADPANTSQPGDPSNEVAGPDSQMEDGYESDFDEPATAPKPDAKTPGKGSEAKKARIGDWVGWTFLGLTVAGIFWMIYSVEKKSAQERLPLHDTSHSKI